MKNNASGISFIIPAYNEENNIQEIVLLLKIALNKAGLPYEIILVNDGSIDKTEAIAKLIKDIILINISHNKGYGNAIKSGIKAAHFAWIGIIDADMSYPTKDIPEFIKQISDNTDMVVGYRSNITEIDNLIIRISRWIFFTLIKALISKDILDPNCGLRIFKRSLADKFEPYLCGTFSFTTSLTLAAKRNGCSIKYIPIKYLHRRGKSKINYITDSFRALKIVFKETAYSYPRKLFAFLTIILLLIFLMVSLFKNIFSYIVH